MSDVLHETKLAEVVARIQWLRGECIRTVLYVPSCCCFDRVHSISVYTHIAIAFAPWSVLLFSSFKVIQRVKNSTGRCEGYTRMLQTMKNYCCLRPRGCFHSQILEDEAEHNIEHGVILLNSWSRWLFVLFSQCRKYEITQGNIIVFYAPWNQTKVAMTVEPPVTKRSLKMQRIFGAQK